MIGFPWIIPTIDEPMSSYTAMAFSFSAIAGMIIVGLLYRWLLREFKVIHVIIRDHDGFVETTSKDIGSMQTDIAVLLEKCGGTKEDVEEIKHSINDINRSLLVMSKK